MYIYICIYVYVYMYICMYIHIYICLILLYSQTELPGMIFGRVSASPALL